MTLSEAINVLLETHVRPDEVSEFVVMMGATPSGPFTERYVEAWEVLWRDREALRAVNTRRNT